MTEFDKKNCILEARSYPHGTELCEPGKCRVCIDGKWVDRDRQFMRR